MNQLTPLRLSALASSLLFAGALAGCQDSPKEQTVGEAVDKTIQDSKETLHDVGDAVDHSIEASKDTLSEAGDTVKEKAGDIADAARETADRVSDSVSDATITASVQASILKDPDLSVLGIDVDTHDGIVALSGRVSSNDAKARAGQIAAGIAGVKSVTNDLVVEGS